MNIKLSEDFLSKLYSKHNKEIINIIDIDGEIISANNLFYQVTGYEEKSLGSIWDSHVFYEKQKEEIQKGLDRLIKGKIESYQVNGGYISDFSLDLIGTFIFEVLKDEAGKIVGFKQRLKKMDNPNLFGNRKDQVTGLPGRQEFMKVLESKIALGDKFSIFFIDLDRFKAINDIHGHEYGDRVLKETAVRIRAGLEETDFLARLGGDEFSAIVNIKEAGLDKIRETASSILNHIEGPYYIEDFEFDLSCSIGISIYPDTSQTISDLLLHADCAMYKIKKTGRSSFSIYSEGLNNKNIRKAKIESEISKALKKEEFRAVYQPLYKTKTIDIVGYEILARWNSSLLGEISPTEFISAAEDCKLIQKLDLKILEKALLDHKRGMSVLSRFGMSINFSALTLTCHAIVDEVRALLEKYKFPFNKLMIEITESHLMDNFSQTKNNLSAFSNMGIKLAIDDFGTGYSSIKYLIDFPVDVIKIDKMFIQDIDENQTKKIVRATIQMAESVGARVLAEGVETQAQYKLLESLGCDRVQGFLLSKPIESPGRSY